jgi:transposase
MSKVYVGLELGASDCWVAIADEGGKIKTHRKFKTTETDLISLAQGLEDEALVLMEECDIAPWARKVLLPHVGEVVVADPRRNLWIYRDSRKDDKIDSRKLAEIARLGTYFPVWHAYDRSMEELHLAVKVYEKLRGDVTRQKNRLKAKLRRQGILWQGDRAYGVRGRQEVLSLVESPVVRDILEADYEILDFLCARQADARARFMRLGRGITPVGALQEIPGVGPYVAAVFCAYVKDPRRFGHRSELTRFSRLGVTRCVSAGKTLKREHLDPAGHGALKDISRKAFQAAMNSGGDNRFKRTYAEALARGGSHDHARLTVQRKILATMLAMWRDGSVYDDNHVAQRRA